MAADQQADLEEPSTRSGAWPEFEAALTAVLLAMDEDQYLILVEKFHHKFVQFAVQGAHGIRVEVSSNYALPGEEALSERAQSRLFELGFSPPTGSIENSTWDKDPDGSPNYYLDVLPKDEVAEIVERVTEVCCDVLGIHHPAGLWYSAFDGSGAKLVFPSLGLTSKERPPRSEDPTGEDSVESVCEKLTETLTDLAGVDDLELNENNHVQLSTDGNEIHVGVLNDPLRVRVWAPVLHQARESLELLRALQHVNGELAYGRVFLADDVVIIADDVREKCYDEAAVLESIGYLNWAAQRLDDKLTAVIEADTPSTGHVAGYL